MQIGGLLPRRGTCVAPCVRIMILGLLERLCHVENVLILVKLVLAVTYHELSARLEQDVNLAVDVVDGSLRRLGHVDRGTSEHALVESRIEIIFVSDELGQVLYLALLICVAANHTYINKLKVEQFY